MIRRRAASARLALTALLALGAAGCAPTMSATATSAQTLVLDRLYFGRAIPAGGIVSDDDWSAFLRERVTPRFPDGLTVWRAEGQWCGAGGETDSRVRRCEGPGSEAAIVRETSFVLEVVHPDDAVSERAVQAIRADYRARFRQQAVLRVTSKVGVEF